MDGNEDDNTTAKLRTYLKRVTADLHDTRERLRQAEAVRTEPLAIIGMSCRFPGGVASPEDWYSATARAASTTPKWAPTA